MILNPTLKVLIIFLYLSFYTNLNIYNLFKVGMMENSKIHPIDLILSQIKPLLMPYFTKRYSRHTCGNKKCNTCLICDGNFKVCRQKCLFSLRL